MRRNTITATLALAAAAMLTLTACGPAFIKVARPTFHETPSVELGSAKVVDAEIRMAVGSLAVSGGAAKLMEGDFMYRPASWKPEISYSVEGTAGTLRVDQPDVKDVFPGSVRNEWNIRLNRDVPMDLSVKLGVGENKLVLGDMSLRSLTVVGGVGRTVVDLTGKPRNDLRVDIESGVGDLTLRVPADAGVRVFGQEEGVGGLQVPSGFTKRPDGGMYNGIWDTATVRIDVHVLRGVGSIVVEQV